MVKKAFCIQREKKDIPGLCWVPKPAWEIMKAYWQSPAFKKLSDQNTKNRLANGSNLTSGYRGGCVKTTIYVDRLTVKLDRLPYPKELFEVTHGTKKGTYPEGRAQDTIHISQALSLDYVVVFDLFRGLWAKRYDDALKAAVEAAGDDEMALTAIDKYQIWINVAGGSRGRVYGLGVLAQLGPRATVSPQFSTTQELKNTVQQLQQQLADRDAQIAKRDAEQVEANRINDLFRESLIASLTQAGINLDLSALSSMRQTSGPSPQDQVQDPVNSSDQNV
ncbi:Transposase, Ptta/En/Spm, plant [Corchorus olitorius]|uniref:Transposase, Ptta/En/Spm, plant n=1 Tax=Corchorus olitorius TaxID=93759 RepID=A0A1R3HQZ4_9ROSI|nr:Transposase, Ptta/En/Spm, plant [Corchorus olitorius]